MGDMVVLDYMCLWHNKCHCSVRHWSVSNKRQVPGLFGDPNNPESRLLFDSGNSLNLVTCLGGCLAQKTALPSSVAAQAIRNRSYAYILHTYIH
jgi:hypothetical protein